MKRSFPLIFLMAQSLIWGGFAWLGFGLVNDQAARATVHSVNIDSLGYYVVYPLVAAVFCLSSGATIAAINSDRRIFKFAAIGLNVGSVLFFLRYMFYYTGGV